MKLIDGEKCKNCGHTNSHDATISLGHFNSPVACKRGTCTCINFEPVPPAPSESALRERIQKNIDEINERARTQPFPDAMGSAMFKDGLMWVLREMDGLSSSPVAPQGQTLLVAGEPCCVCKVSLTAWNTLRADKVCEKHRQFVTEGTEFKNFGTAPTIPKEVDFTPREALEEANSRWGPDVDATFCSRGRPSDARFVVMGQWTTGPGWKYLGAGTSFRQAFAKADEAILRGQK